MLYETFLENAVMIKQSIVPDNIGGAKIAYTDGDSFKAAFVVENSSQDQSAQAVKSNVSCEITSKHELKYGDVVKRLKDGEFYRVLSNSDDKKTPSACSFDFNVVVAERWVIPQDE